MLTLLLNCEERDAILKMEDGGSDSFCIRPDFILEDKEGHTCVVDAKYYSRSLPKKEILKLVSDRSLLDANGALLVLGEKTKLSKKTQKMLQENNIIVVQEESRAKNSSPSFKQKLAEGVARCFAANIYNNASISTTSKH